MGDSYFTRRFQQYKKEQGVYHNREDCPQGGKIQMRYRIAGTHRPGERRKLCDHCAALARIDDMQWRQQEID